MNLKFFDCLLKILEPITGLMVEPNKAIENRPINLTVSCNGT